MTDEEILKFIEDPTRITGAEQTNYVIGYLSGLVTDLELALDDQSVLVSKRWNELYEENKENKAKTDRLMDLEPVQLTLRAVKRKLSKARRDRQDIIRKYEVITTIKRSY